LWAGLKTHGTMCAHKMKRKKTITSRDESAVNLRAHERTLRTARRFINRWCSHELFEILSFLRSLWLGSSR